MNNNVTNLADFAKRRQEQLRTEKVVPYDKININNSASTMLMSVQHQINFMLHQAMCSFGDLAVDRSVSFVQMLEILRSYYQNVFLPMDIFHAISARHIHYTEIDKEEKQKSDEGISAYSHHLTQVTGMVDPGEIMPLCSIEMRLSDFDISASAGFNLNDYTPPVVKEAPAQYQQLFANIMNVTRSNGGCAFHIPRDRDLVLFFIPYSPGHFIQTAVQFQNNFVKETK